MTKLKEMTFAVLAENQNSIAHNWFQQAFSQNINWIPGNWYIYNPKAGLPLTARKGECDCEIKWSEDQFESIFVDEEFGSSKQLDHYAKNMQFCGKISIRENTQTFPKNTAFGTGNIAHEHVSSEKKITKEDVIPKERIRLAQYYLECMTKKLIPHFKFTEDYSDLKDKMDVDALVNNVYSSIMNGKSVGNTDAKLQDAEKAIEIYKNDVEAKAKRIKSLEDVIDDKCREVSSLVKRNIQLSRDFAEKTESQEKIIKSLRGKINGRDGIIKDLKDRVHSRETTNKALSEILNGTNPCLYKEDWDQYANSFTAIANKLKNQELKFPKDRIAGKWGTANMPQKLTVGQSERIVNNDTSIKLPEPFHGVTIEMSAAIKMLRSDMKLPEDVKLRIV